MVGGQPGLGAGAPLAVPSAGPRARTRNVQEYLEVQDT